MQRRPRLSLTKLGRYLPCDGSNLAACATLRALGFRSSGPVHDRPTGDAPASQGAPGRCRTVWDVPVRVSVASEPDPQPSAGNTSSRSKRSWVMSKG